MIEYGLERHGGTCIQKTFTRQFSSQDSVIQLFVGITYLYSLQMLSRRIKGFHGVYLRPLFAHSAMLLRALGLLLGAFGLSHPRDSPQSVSAFCSWEKDSARAASAPVIPLMPSAKGTHTSSRRCGVLGCDIPLIRMECPLPKIA